MGTLSKSGPTFLIICNVLIVISILVLEKFAIGSHVYSAIKSSHDSFLGELVFNNGKAISRTLVLSIVIFLILIQKNLNDYRRRYVEYFSGQAFYFLVAQVVVFALFYQCTDFAFQISSLQPMYQLLWVLLGTLLIFLTLMSIADYRFWQHLLVQQKWALLISIIISSVVWWISSATQGLWDHFADFTFYLVAGCLSWISGDVLVDPINRIIGFNEFFVNIDTQCSGYEGIGLVSAFVFVYLYSFRQDFRFPRALLLFPIGAVIIWLFNIVRIVALILIGALWSPDVAVWGFHTQAGWITFIITSVGLMWLAHQSSFFVKKQENNHTLLRSINLPIATLLPLIALLAMTFITQALSAQFDWLYPLRVFVVGCVIVYCFRFLKLTPLKWNYFSILAGIVVAVMWIVMVDINPETDQIYSTEFSQTATWMVWLWLAFRFLGSVITVPIAEELGFRSYLLCKLSSTKVTNTGPIMFSMTGLLVSSIAFGLLHGAWLEGTLAGLIYAWVRYKSTHILDAIIAHGITNAVLFGFVLYTGHWSLL